MNKTPTLSILIPTRNRAVLCQRAIDSVPWRGDVEVIVADNSDVGKGPIHSKRSDLVWLEPDTATIPMWSNWQRALDRARGEWVMVLTDKAVIVPGALDALLGELRTAGDLVTWNIARPQNATNFPQVLWSKPREIYKWEMVRNLWRYWDLTDEFPHGANMCWRRPCALKQEDEVDEPLFTALNPDYIAGMRLVNGCGTVKHLGFPVTAIPRDVGAANSTGASVALGRPEAQEYLNSLPPFIGTLGDRMFCAEYIVRDAITVFGGENVCVDYLRARWLRHVFDRARAGVGMTKDQRRILRGCSVRDWLVFAADLARDVRRRVLA